MSFSSEVKLELLRKKFSLEEAKVFIEGIITSSGQRDGSKFLVKFNRNVIAESIKNIAKQADVLHDLVLKHKNWILFHDFSLNSPIKLPGIFFAGVFLGGGSISNPNSASYHLEIIFYSHFAAVKVQRFLNKYNFQFFLIQRNTQHILYIKKANQISDFLKAIEAFQSLVIFEEFRIKRDFQNNLNRYSNLDTYNQKKLANASVEFKKKYLFILNNNLQIHFNEKELLFYKFKLANPYSSLAELAELYNEKVKFQKTKSGLNHYLRKLRKIYSQNKN